MTHWEKYGKPRRLKLIALRICYQCGCEAHKNIRLCLKCALQQNERNKISNKKLNERKIT